MELNYSQIFNSRVLDQIKSYCALNNVEDADKFISDCFTQGFNIEKYGLLGKTLNDSEKHLKTGGVEEKHITKEVIVEKRVEIPVEVIKEIEKIVEVPVDRIVEIEKIVEVPVEVIKEVEKIVEVEKVVTKVEYICDKESENELGGIIAKLEENIFQLNKELDSERKIFSIKTEEMENNFQNEMSKKDKELDELRHNLDILLDKPPVEIIKEVEVIKEIPVEIIKEVEVIREVEKPNDTVKLLQQTIQNLTSDVRELKKKNEELEKKLLDQPRQNGGDIPARFHGSSNLNDGLYK